MTRHKEIIWFLIASLALSSLVYNDAMWGKSMLAPLDLGPDLFSQYKFMDSTADGIPDNHYIIDQFTYDLPLQHTIYEAYHSGEIPWWDPYTYGGRPLLADAHINGTDPIRLLCYATLPFELAYNWNLILRGIITGLGMFLLLRLFRIDTSICIILSLTYQFSGWFTLYFGHPWIQGSFVYFPFLWIAWTKAINGRALPNTGLAALLCGMVFYAGNLQSHTYLPVFALSFIIAFAVKDRRQFFKACAVTTASGFIGALIAFPVLANQIEFFLISARTLGNSNPWYLQLLAVPFSFAAIYPWMFGTFRTLDIGRLVNMTGMAFQWFCGIATLMLAIWGAWALRRKQGEAGIAICQAIVLVIFYLLIVSTPLCEYMYPRSAPLAGMGLIVLSAFAIQAVMERKMCANPRIVKLLLAVVVAIGTTTSVLAWWVYPVFRDKVQAKVDLADKNNTSLLSAPELRRFQVDGFPREVSLANPECILTIVAAAALAWALLAGDGRRVRTRMVVALLLSAIPVIHFHMRFRPRHPVELWDKLLAGGSTQNTALRQLAGGLRLDETATKAGDRIFPLAFAALYRIHALHGYSALQPPTLYNLPSDSTAVPPDWRADYVSDPRSDEVAPLVEITGSHPSRFRSSTTGAALPISTAEESHNRLVLNPSALARVDSFIRTDTWFPGWTASAGGKPLLVGKFDPCFISIHGLNAIPPGDIVMKYTPRSLAFAVPIMSVGILLCGYLLCTALPTRKLA